MAKETAASYKLDFKYTFKDGVLKNKSFLLADFSRRKYYHNHFSSFDYAMREAYFNSPNYTHGDQFVMDTISSSSEMAEAEAAFQKWLKRREPIINAWNDYLEYQNDSKTPLYYREQNVPSLNTPISLQNIADRIRSRKFRACLETSRPYNLPITAIVKLDDKYINNYRYDPFYWGQHHNSPRIGTIVRYGDDISGKGGVGSRMIEVMFFASGESKSIPERCLRLHDSNNTTES